MDPSSPSSSSSIPRLNNMPSKAQMLNWVASAFANPVFSIEMLNGVVRDWFTNFEANETMWRLTFSSQSGYSFS